MWNMPEFGIQIEWAMTGQSRTTTSRRKELYIWYCACVVKCSWRKKPSRWTRRPTPMTTWKPRSTETSTRSTTQHEHVNVRVVVTVFLVLVLSWPSHSFFAHIAWLKVPECLSHPIHAWSERSLWLPWPLHHIIFLFSFFIILKQFLLPFNFPEVK